MKARTKSRPSTERNKNAVNVEKRVKIQMPPPPEVRRAAVALLLDERLGTINQMTSEIEQKIIWTLEIAEGVLEFQQGLERLYNALDRFDNIRCSLSESFRSALARAEQLHEADEPLSRQP